MLYMQSRPLIFLMQYGLVARNDDIYELKFLFLFFIFLYRRHQSKI